MVKPTKTEVVSTGNSAEGHSVATAGKSWIKTSKSHRGRRAGILSDEMRSMPHLRRSTITTSNRPWPDGHGAIK
jgi:hypothetical protein